MTSADLKKPTLQLMPGNEEPGANDKTLTTWDQKQRHREKEWQEKRHRREQQWCAETWMQYGERGQGASPEQQAKLDAAIKEQLAEGPGYKRRRRDSYIQDAPRHQLSKRDLRRLHRRVREIKASGPVLPEKLAAQIDAKRMPKGLGDALDALIDYALEFGTIFPSLTTLAWRARCSVNALLRYLRVLAFFGLVTVTRRRKLIETELGKKEVQASNCYELHVPGGDAEPVEKPAKNPRQSSDVKVCRPSSTLPIYNPLTTLSSPQTVPDRVQSDAITRLRESLSRLRDVMKGKESG
jgi:hypothetical protein